MAGQIRKDTIQANPRVHDTALKIARDHVDSGSYDGVRGTTDSLLIVAAEMWRESRQRNASLDDELTEDDFVATARLIYRWCQRQN